MSSTDRAAIRTDRVGPSPFIAVDYCGNGELILFFHGVGGHRSNWLDQLSTFGNRYLAASWDTRGYGESDDYEGDFDFGEVVADALRIISHFGHRHAHIVGLSIGGKVAIELCLRHRHAVSSLVIADSYPAQHPSERRAALLAERQAPLFSGGAPKDIAEHVARSLVSPNAQGGAYERLIHSISLARRESYLKSIKASQAFDRWSDLPNLRVPTLIVVGSDDTLTTPADMRKVHQKITGSIFVEIPNAGHLCNIDQPQLFNQHVGDFLISQQHIG